MDWIWNGTLFFWNLSTLNIMHTGSRNGQVLNIYVHLVITQKQTKMVIWQYKTKYVTYCQCTFHCILCINKQMLLLVIGLTLDQPYSCIGELRLEGGMGLKESEKGGKEV